MDSLLIVLCIIIITYLAYLAHRDAKWVKDLTKKDEKPHKVTGYQTHEYMLLENADKKVDFSDFFKGGGEKNLIGTGPIFVDQRLGD